WKLVLDSVFADVPGSRTSAKRQCLKRRRLRLFVRADRRDGPLPGEHKRVSVEVHLPAQLKMARGAGEAPCAAGHVRIFMVIVHSRGCRGRQVSVEGAL